jgi:hypothetical protein
MNHEEMTVSQSNFSATCRRGDNGDPEWSGYNQQIGNPLMNIFRNDMIHAPTIVTFALEWAWRRWKDGAATEDQLQAGLEELFSWIDETARGKPARTLWQGAF